MRNYNSCKVNAYTLHPQISRWSKNDINGINCDWVIAFGLTWSKVAF